MCCITTIVLVLGSRIGIVYLWLTNRPLFTLAFKNWSLPGSFAISAWIWTLLGGIFLPWTTLAYVFVFPGGIVGNEWIVLGIAFLIDLTSHGGGYHHSRRVYRR